MSDYRIEKPERLAIGLASRPEEVLLVGNGALLYKDAFSDLGSVVELGTMSHSFPNACSLVELALPRMLREDFDSLYELRPLYLRQSARRIRWERIRDARSA